MTTNTTEQAQPAAKQALEIHKRNGEQAMLAFLVVNVPNPDEFPWLEDEFHCTFDDHSIIARHDEGPQLNHGLATHAHYHLRWEDQHGPPNTATLPSEIDITDAPEVPPPPVPAIPTPTTRDVWQYAMDALATHLGEDAQRSQQPALEIHDSHLAAPSLLCDIHRAAADHRPSPETEQALQAEARKLAQQVLAHLPASERQALTERIIHMQRATSA